MLEYKNYTKRYEYSKLKNSIASEKYINDLTKLKNRVSRECWDKKEQVVGRVRERFEMNQFIINRKDLVGPHALEDNRSQFNTNLVVSRNSEWYIFMYRNVLLVRNRWGPKITHKNHWISQQYHNTYDARSRLCFSKDGSLITQDYNGKIYWKSKNKPVKEENLPVYLRINDDGSFVVFDRNDTCVYQIGKNVSLNTTTNKNVGCGAYDIK